MATNPYTQITVTGYAATEPTDDGSATVANTITWAGIKTYLTDTLKTAVESVDQNVSSAFATTNIGLVSIKLDAGTTARAPIILQAGTNLTTAAAGRLEYDGKTFYSTVAASARGVAPSEQFVCNASDVTMNNDTSAQSPFASANDTFTAAAACSYFFESLIYLTHGTTATVVEFGLGGTATYTSVMYESVAYDLNDYDAPDLLSRAVRTSETSTPIFDTAGNASTVLKLSGIIRVNAAGTMIPQIRFATAPGTTVLGKTNSYFRLYPVGSNSVAAVGNWA